MNARLQSQALNGLYFYKICDLAIESKFRSFAVFF
jgi:hypothetical protein